MTFEFDPVTITATAPAKPALTYKQAAGPIPFKIANAVGFIGAGLLWFLGWKRTAVAVAGVHVVDLVGRQLSPGYAKETDFFTGYRR